MAEYLIDMSQKIAINFNPPDKETEILQNARTILATTTNSVPLDRDIGIDSKLVDLPLPIAQAKLSAEIIDKLQRFEPRIEVTRVKFSGDGNTGKLAPAVYIKIKDGD